MEALGNRFLRQIYAIRERSTVPLRAWLPPLIIKSGTRFGARSKFWGVVRVGGQGWG